MLRLSRRSWNNLIIFGVLALFFLFYLAPNHLAFMLNQQQPLTSLVTPGQRILELQFPAGTLRQFGPGWRFEPAVTSQPVSAEWLLEQWSTITLPPGLPVDDSQLLARICLVGLRESGNGEIRFWEFVFGDQQWYLRQQQQLFPLSQQAADALCPPQLR